MSHRATVWAIEQKLPALAKLVLLILADRHNGDTNRCDPSMDRVAVDCGMSKDSVKRQVKILEGMGLIVVHQRKTGTVNLTNFYSFNMEVLRGVSANSTQGVGAISTPNQEVIQPGSKEEPPADEEVGLSPEKKAPRDAIRRLFTYYLEGTGRRPRMYELTKARIQKGLLRLADCQRKCGGDLAKAEELFGIAIDAMLSSEFHMGQNDQKKQYTDWIDHLCKSTEKIEWWLAR